MQIIEKFMSDFGHLGLAEIGIIMAVLIMDAALSGDNSIAINALAMERFGLGWCWPQFCA